MTHGVSLMRKIVMLVCRQVRDSRNRARAVLSPSPKLRDAACGDCNKGRSELGDLAAMLRISGSYAIMLLAIGSTAAMAQDAAAVSAAAIQQACRADYESYCIGEDPSLPIETACLR